MFKKKIFFFSWPCPSLWKPVDLWTLAAMCWWIFWSGQLAVLVQQSENNNQSKWTFHSWVTLSSWRVTFPWFWLFTTLKLPHVLWYCQGRKWSWGLRLLREVYLQKSPGLNLRLLCSIRDGKVQADLIMVTGPELPRISRYSTSQKWDKDKEEGR